LEKIKKIFKEIESENSSFFKRVCNTKSVIDNKKLEKNRKDVEKYLNLISENN